MMTTENKCCGNCKYFKDEDVEGWETCKFSRLTKCDDKCIYHSFINNGWTEITPDNVEELYKVLDMVIIAHFIPDTVVKNVVAYEKPNEVYRSLELIAKEGGYYYYVLPELKINNE